MSSFVRRLELGSVRRKNGSATENGRFVGAPGKGTPERSGPPRGSRRGKPSKFRMKREN